MCGFTLIAPSVLQSKRYFASHVSHSRHCASLAGGRCSSGLNFAEPRATFVNFGEGAGAATTTSTTSAGSLGACPYISNLRRTRTNPQLPSHLAQSHLAPSHLAPSYLALRRTRTASSGPPTPKAAGAAARAIGAQGRRPHRRASIDEMALLAAVPLAAAGAAEPA